MFLVVLMTKKKENGTPAFAGVTAMIVENMSMKTIVMPAKAGIPFGFLSSLMSFSADG